MFFGAHSIQDDEDDQVEGGFVELHRVQGFIQGYGRGEIGAETHTPGKIAFPAPAATGGETAETADGLADDDAGREDVHSWEERHLVAAHDDDCGDESDDEAAMEDASGLQGFESEDLAGILEVLWEVKQKHEQLGAQDSSDGAIEGEIGYVIGIHARALGEAQHDEKPVRKPRATRDAIGGDVERTNANEFGEHTRGLSVVLCGLYSCTMRALSP